MNLKKYKFYTNLDEILYRAEQFKAATFESTCFIIAEFTFI